MGTKKSYDQEQLIFPDIKFTCSGHVVKWIMGGEWNEGGDYYPQLQIWRPSGDSMYHRHSGSNTTTAVMIEDGVYELSVCPILVEPGDVLGILQPSSDISRLQVDYDDGRDSTCHYASIDGMPAHTDVDINDIPSCTNTGIPLVTVEIGKLSFLLAYHISHNVVYLLQ